MDKDLRSLPGRRATITMSKKFICLLFALIALVSTIYGAENCPAGEVYYKCSLAKCYKTCKDLKSRPPCPAIDPACNLPSCECQDQELRNDQGTCVAIANCSPPHCDVGEVYNPCGTSRLETCEERGNTCEPRPLYCVEGCFCPGGSFLTSNGSCVPEQECPPRTCDGPNEYFDECPKVCADDQLCSNVRNGITCPEMVDCCEPQCRCKEGYYKDIEGICITADECWSDSEEYAPENRLGHQNQDEHTYS